MDLKEVLSKRILDQILGQVKVSKGEYLVLVLDKVATKIVSSACKMQDVLTRGVTLVESLEKLRAPMKLDAVYIMEPSAESVNKFLPDWDGTGQVGEPLYKGAHVFFTESCPDELFKKFAHPQVRKYLRTLKEADICFLANQSRVFTLNYPNAFLDFYKADHNAKGPLFTKLASQLASLCYALEENPTIRYRQGLTRIKDFADIVQGKLDEFKSQNPDLGTVGRKPKSQLIILDRGFDPVTPILHHLTLQAMVYDLIGIENDQYSFKFKSQLGIENTKKVQLDDTDDTWRLMRHQHIAEASKKVSNLVRDFLAEKKMSKVEDDNISLKNLHALMQQLPQYRRQLNQFMLHFTIVEEALSAYNVNKYDAICRLEQTLATGEDENQEQVQDGMKLIIPALLDDNFTSQVKARIVALYLLMSKGGVTPDTFGRLMQHSNIIGDMRATLLNLQYLGVSVIKEKGSSTPNVLKRIPRDPSKFYPQSRWVPILQDILEYTMDERLDFSYCACTKGPAAGTDKDSGAAGKKGTSQDVRSARGWVWQRGATPGAPGAPSGSLGSVGDRATIIVFIMGGVTYAELRVVYELMNTRIEENRKYADNYNIVIGSTDVVTPLKFFSLVEKLPHIVT